MGFFRSLRNHETPLVILTHAGLTSNLCTECKFTVVELKTKRKKLPRVYSSIGRHFGRSAPGPYGCLGPAPAPAPTLPRREATDLYRLCLPEYVVLQTQRLCGVVVVVLAQDRDDHVGGFCNKTFESFDHSAAVISKTRDKIQPTDIAGNEQQTQPRDETRAVRNHDCSGAPDGVEIQNAAGLKTITSDRADGTRSESSSSQPR